MKSRFYKLLFLGVWGVIVTSISSTMVSSISSTITIPSSLNDYSIEKEIIAIAPAVINLKSDIKKPVITPPALPVKLAKKPVAMTVNHKIKAGESLSSIFFDLDISKHDLTAINRNRQGKQFSAIVSGKNLVLNIDAKGQLQKLSYKKNFIETIVATRARKGFKVKIFKKPTERKIASAYTVIKSSLSTDARRAGLPNKSIKQLNDVFAWDAGFANKLRKGDQLTVIYEQLFVDNKRTGTGNILSAEFISRGRASRAVRFKDKKGHVDYYTPNGNSMRTAFLRKPVASARISSGYTLRRKHPVLHTVRAHKGVDYAAKTGTPVKATGDGKITYRSRKGGFGRVIEIQHGKKYKTVYAHLSAYKSGQHVGNYIKQGQVIGYVGRSGVATGSHLHYEFHVNGKHTNPLKIKLPKTLPIRRSLFAAFKKQTRPYVAQLNKAKAQTLLARNIH